MAPDESDVKIGQRLRVGGLVVVGSVMRDPKSLRVHFDLTDMSGEVVTVVFENFADLFREGRGLLLKESLLL